MSRAERAPQTSDVVTEADFVRRRRDRLSAEHDPALFATAYSCPVPSPDGRMLAWISDRDGRPRAWVAPLPPDGSAVAEPAWPLPTDGGEPRRRARGTCRRSPGRPDGYWLACQLAPGGGERTRVRLVTPDGTQVHDLAPSAPAVTLGSWSPSGRQLGITIFGAGTGDGVASLVDVRDGTSTMLTSGPAALVCAISGDGMRAVVRVGRRGARRLEHFDLRSGRCTELLPGGEANVADARFGITGGQLFVHSDAGGERPALLAVGLNGDAEPSLPYVVAGRDEHDLDLVALDPAGARAALVWNVDGRSEVDLLDLRSGITEPLPRPPGDVVTGRRSPATGARSWSGTRARRSRRRSPGSRWTTLSDRGGRPAIVTRRADRSRPLLPAAPRDAGHLVDPVLHHFPGEDGLPLSGWLFRPASAFGAAYPTLDLAARRPGGPGTPDLPAAVPGAARRGRRGVRAERARLRRVRPHVLPGRRPGPAVRRDHRRARRGHVAGRARAWPTRRGSGCPAGRTAAT